MASKKMDEEEFLKLKEIEDEIAASCKAAIKAVEAWRYFILWISSFSNSVQPGKGDANHYLSPQQSSEFAFSYDPTENPDIFVLLAQNKIYECFCDIGIKCAIVEDDGVVIIFRDLDINGFFISGFSLKIQCALALTEKLKKMKKYAKEFQVGRISGAYNPVSDNIGWRITDVHDVNFPVATNLFEAKYL